MQSFIHFVKWTQQGTRAIKETVRRSRAARDESERRGLKTVDLFWDYGGPRDLIWNTEAPDERGMAAATLAIRSLGNVQVETMWAFTEQEMDAIAEDL